MRLITISIWLFIILFTYNKCLKVKNIFYIPSNKENIFFENGLKKRKQNYSPKLFYTIKKYHTLKNGTKQILGSNKDNDNNNNDSSDINEEYKVFQKTNFIKKYQITKEEIDTYIEQIKNSKTSGYEPKFPKDAFRTPDGLTNVILDYKYKNDNLKIHNYYYFFMQFLKKLSESNDNLKQSKNDNSLINIHDFLYLKKKGFFEGELYTWKNWVILNRGEWKDEIGYDNEENGNYEIKTIRPIVEPKMKRMPIEYWGSFRAIDFNVNHYPIYKKLFDYFNKTNVNEDEPYHKIHPFLFYPRFSVGRDRGGLSYGDANYFGNYGDIYKKNEEREKRLNKLKENNNENTSMDFDFGENYNYENEQNEDKESVINSSIHKEHFIDKYDFGPNDIKIEEATDVLVYPQNGRLYQKFYIGPLNITDGHTFGSLIKYVCQSQIYGYAIVGIKIHNMNEDTKIENTQEDLLEIALNLSDVCIYSKEINLETNIRLIFKGPLMLVAGMIPLPSHLKVVNKEQYICTIKENGYIDISIKIEYGKGHWVTYEKGLYKREIGSDNECMKKRPIKEVINNNYTPLTASFSACRMVRTTVHKIATKYWCEDRCEFTDPKQMLVVEIWTDPRMLPKNVLLYGIKNIKKILKKFREMIINDTDFPCEEEDREIKKLWPYIDRYKYLQTKQKMEGGPPIVNIDEELNKAGTNINTDQNGLKIDDKNIQNPFTQALMDPGNFPKHSNIMLPLQETPPPYIDTLDWLKTEVNKDKNSTKRDERNKEKNDKSKNKRTFDYDNYLDDQLADILSDNPRSQ
ncbi:DNA-directed RNA polymerase, alpha subunit, putative [Plasmodium vinckei vinckei]|uniref:DNA-directed RNA polymerase, alpha subunit, putative n=1 Tax=Plasmodium vinckei vinckei TaxID=54757 RepID=A0A449BY84_PLAVN|nr:DNA-directed RNA polymerase, alpha subunit, putative [Plasmodium vinckei vinckei]KEG04794.1 DNA-directed RNA polymerase subunit alpha [Plasmodium vinckei vinckei]VEV58447.1 DNA-directed RNA polymerase, alpha subunit, putative [Plasmodium vinckei vinckei]